MMVNGVFVPTTSNLNESCGDLSVPTMREACLKHPDLIPVLLQFQKCSDYSILYPTGGDLLTRRRWYRADVFLGTLRLGLGIQSTLPPSLVQITNVVNDPPTTPLLLNLQLCYLTFVADIEENASRIIGTTREDCSSPKPTEKCFSNSHISVAMERFQRCSGFPIDEVPLACANSTMVTNVLQNYDVLATVIPFVQSNYADDLTSFFDTFTNNVTMFTTADCALCFRELAMDMQQNILTHQAESTRPVFEIFISPCGDPHSLSCVGLMGINALLNFQQCAGTSLQIDQLVTTTTTPTTSQVENTTSTTPGPQNGILESASPSSIVVALTVLVAFAF